MTAALFFAAFLAKYWSFYKTSLTEEPSGRYESIDGLRGILAFGVFFQHAVTNLAYYQTGVWQITDLKFYRFLGGESVILFFMITSFLYWSKAIAKKGKLNTYSIYRNRLYRLAPMYLFTAAIISFIALAQSNFTIISIVQLVRDILSWLTLGIATTLTVNDVSIIPINAGIHWTLHFEWILYILLPFAAMILQNKKMFCVPQR
ncbi:MAG: acyltransferase family protein [Patescibacteria group bacterium]